MSSDRNFISADLLYNEEYFQVFYEGGEFYRKRQVMYGMEHRRIAKFISSGRVLDYGCGLGEFLERFDGARWQKYGTDISPYALESARRRGIIVDIPEAENFFDLIVLRGCLQHLDEPLGVIRKCVRWLKPGGYLIFLATPNAGSLCYRLFQNLPMLDPARNFVVFSDSMLQNCLRQFGLRIVHTEYPYRGTPYAKPFHDLLRFCLRCIGVKTRFAFWGNVMECYARK